MFKHHQVARPEKDANPEPNSEIIEKPAPPEAGQSLDIRALLEKNLKWSQIIYEQNRKLNRKLLWMAIGSWLRALIILVPLVAAVLYGPTLYRKLQASYGSFFQDLVGAGGVNPSTASDLLKILPLNDTQREQLKTILK